MWIKQGIQRISYKLLMLGIVAVTGIAIGGKFLYDWLHPVPEATLSADLTRQYARLFQKLDIQEVISDHDSWNNRWMRAARRQKEGTFALEESDPGAGYCPVTMPFDVRLQGHSLAAFANVDKSRFTYQEYHGQVSRCLDTILAGVQHADAAVTSWKHH